jgi:hypothetical protein
MLGTSRLTHLGVSGPFSSLGPVSSHGKLIWVILLCVCTVLLLHLSVRKSLQMTSMIEYIVSLKKIQLRMFLSLIIFLHDLALFFRIKI